MNLFNEIIVDNFAGGGGASEGIKLAIGRDVDVAINHDPAAIAMHRANHPGTEHYCESVWDIDPPEATKGRLVGLCWFSPDCKHFSKAKGGKPVEKNIRGLAWVAVRWAATVRPRVIILENVEEFKTWGPLLKNGMPDPDKKGRTFGAFVNALKRLGYQVDHRELKACDYGAPTIRKRLFLIARNDGRPIVWPKPTHGDPNSAAVKKGKLKPWRTAAEIIDWSLPCPSIFERKRPLAENTLRRIARGIMRFVVDNPNPFIVNYKFQNEPESMERPLSTVTSVNGHYLVTPVIGRQFGKSVGHEVDDPLGTVTAGGGGKSQLVTATLAAPHITKFRGQSTGHQVDEPLHTITSGAGSKRPAGAAHALGMVSATLVQTGYGERDGQLPRVPGIDKPLGTAVAGGQKHAVVEAFLTKYHGSKSPKDVRGQTPDEALRTLDTSNRYGLVAAYVSKYYAGESRSTESRIDDGLHTVTARNTHALVTSHLVKLKGDNTGQPVTEPLQTITAGGNHFGEVRAFLLKYTGLGDINGRDNGNKGIDSTGHIQNSSERGNLENSGQNQSWENNSDYSQEGRVQVKERLSGDNCLDERKAVSCPCTSGGLDNARGGNPSGHGFESQGRKQNEQFSEQFGTGNTFKEHQACLCGRSQKGNELCGGLRRLGEETEEPEDVLLKNSIGTGDITDNGFSGCAAFLTKFYGTATGQAIDEPLHTVTAKDRIGLVTIHGQDYQIIDIGMRMLEPHELFAAQGFPTDYIIDQDADGRPFTKAQQVAKCGNAVPPPFAEALVRANLPDICTGAAAERVG